MANMLPVTIAIRHVRQKLRMPAGIMNNEVGRA